MEPQQQKWVFTELVPEGARVSQLLAYAFYKVDKDDVARQCRTVRHLSGDALAQELQSFHDQVAHSPRRMNDYRVKANDAIERLFLNASIKLEQAHKQQVATLEQSLWNKWGERAANYSDYLKKSRGIKRFLLWLLSWISLGASGLLATSVTTLLIVGAVSFIQPQVRDVARVTLKGMVDTLIPPLIISHTGPSHRAGRAGLAEN